MSSTASNKRYRAALRAAGKCWHCTADAEPGTSLCARHTAISRARKCTESERERQRNAYRLKRGIPLDAPLSKRGRPRKEGAANIEHRTPNVEHRSDEAEAGKGVAS